MWVRNEVTRLRRGEEGEERGDEGEDVGEVTAEITLACR